MGPEPSVVTVLACHGGRCGPPGCRLCQDAAVIARPPLAVPLVALTGFLILLGLEIAGWAPLDRVDTAISEAFRSYGETRPGLVSGLRLATDVAATLPFVTGGLAASVLLLHRGERRSATFCVAVTVLVPMLWGVMHWLLHHPRPQDGFVVVHSNGFPSGHTTMGTAGALMALFLLWPRLGSAGRVVGALSAAGFATFIGATRVALLAHWPVDVLGGWLLALTVVPLAAYAATGGRPARSGRRPFVSRQR